MSPRSSTQEPRALLRKTLERAAHYLPAQAPLEVFVHHNTLHAYQHLPFHQAIAAAQTKLGVHGYLREESYHQALTSGRILEGDLEAVIAEATFATTPVAPGFPPERTVARLVTRHSIGAESPASLHWQIVEKLAINQFATDVPVDARRAIVTATDMWLAPRMAGHAEVDDGHSKLFRLADKTLSADEDVARLIVGQPEFLTPAAELATLLGTRARPEAFMARHEAVAVRSLWTACVDACRHLDGAPHGDEDRPVFPREALLAVSDEDADDLVHATVVPLCAAFLDRGQSHWSMPDREQGFFRAWLGVMLTGRSVRPGWLSQLGPRLRTYQQRHVDGEEVALELLTELGITDDERERFVERTLLRLPGFAGMFARLETAPGPIGRSRARVNLVDFLAVRLLLDIFAFQDIARRLGHHGPVAEIRRFCAHLPRIAPPPMRGPHDTAWPLFILAQHAGVAAPTIRGARREHIDTVIALLDRLDDTARLVLWHEAYERRYRTQLLDAVAANLRSDALTPEVDAPRFQVVFCIDDRFESSRRHLEELSSECETFGTAGFFGLAIAYQGIDDPNSFPLCPVVVTPQHRIDEEPLTQQWNLAELRKQRLRGWGRATTLWNRAHRSLVIGMFISIAAGTLAVVPLLASVFWPRKAGQLRQALGRRLLPEPKTRLTPARLGAEDMAAAELYAGFSHDEEALRVGNLLENIGLTRRFAGLVAVLGHDSSSVNNPYFPAYSCGACGGRSGGPNARLFARMANHPEVRERLRARGIEIPADTVFVGGVYDTCAERVRFFDVEALAPAAQPELARLEQVLAEMCRRNAHERCRRFESAPPRPSPEQARQHVEERALDLSQARPELGHATNAACIVGRRALSQGLFLDRRAFLVSYDPSIDPSGAVLERTLAAVGPVGAGINLEYYFSTVDGERLGSGTKLPHNVTGLFGVMNGAASDLRTGLPKQMTEIHEPVRMHLVVEATPEMLTRVCERQPEVAELVMGEWVRLAAVHPETRQIFTFDARHGFVPYTPQNPTLPSVSRSRDWYAGQAGFLSPVRVAPRDLLVEPFHA